MTLKEILFDEITESGLLDDKLFETIVEGEEFVTDVNNEGEELKNTIIEYMKGKEMDLTQENYNLVLKYFQSNANEEGQFCEKIKNRKTTVNVLEKFSENEMKDLLQLCLLKELQRLRKSKIEETKYEYTVESVQDLNTGATNVRGMIQIMHSYAKEGWRVKSIFTNEIAKSSFAAGVGNFSSGTNSTMDQVIIVFERKSKNN